MERRGFLKLGLGLVAAATALAGANAAALPPIQTMPGLAPPRSDGAEPALVTQGEVDHLKPEQVHWGHHWHWHRHWHRWHWHRRHWHWRHWGWHHRHWRHRWHRHYW